MAVINVEINFSFLYQKNFHGMMPMLCYFILPLPALKNKQPERQVVVGDDKFISDFH
jgi:hypothetical protein